MSYETPNSDYVSLLEYADKGILPKHHVIQIGYYWHMIPTTRTGVRKMCKKRGWDWYIVRRSLYNNGFFFDSLGILKKKGEEK